jgi:hypothetical protein
VVPLLVGVYRNPKTNGQTFGMLNDNKRYLLGSIVRNGRNYGGTEWRNRLFEKCNGETMKIIDSATPRLNDLKSYQNTLNIIV